MLAQEIAMTVPTRPLRFRLLVVLGGVLLLLAALASAAVFAASIVSSVTDSLV